MKRVVVIGGGLGGLAAGLRLKHRGFSVTICEAGPTFGGKMNRWCEQGFRFDTGPSLITMPWVFEDLFRALGSRLADHLQLIPLSPLSEYFFDDGTRFSYTSQLPEWLRTLKHLEPSDVDGFLRFQHLGARLFEVSNQTFLRRSPGTRPSRADLSVLKHLPLRHGWGNYHRTVAAHFRSPYLRQLFDRYPTYVGSSPYRSPATLAIIPYMEYAFGGYAVRGGLYTIVEALLSLAGGIDLRPNAEVTHIETRAGAVTGVELSGGERIPADIVIMNGDSATLGGLLNGGPVEKDQRSLSGYVMLLGIRRSLPELQQHSVYFSSDYAHEFSDLEHGRFPSEPTVYVNAASRGDRSLVPGGQGETLFIMANAPATAGTWEEAPERIFERLRRSGFPDIRQDIVVQDTWTPRRIADRYRMPGGSIYGSDSHGWKNAFLRPPNRHRHVGGLYRVGGSTHPGGGTPTVLLSAEITCNLI